MKKNRKPGGILPIGLILVILFLMIYAIRCNTVRREDINSDNSGTWNNNISSKTYKGLSKEMNNAIEEFVSPYYLSKNFSGNILIAHGEEVIFQKSYGMANYEHEISIKPETVFYIGSVSKTFTSAAIFQLIENGLIELNDPLNKFIPDYPNGDIITIRHLLLHTSGIPRIFSLSDYNNISRQENSVEEMVNLMKYEPLIHKPGERRSYSGPNYHLLAYIVELTSGIPFGDYLKANLIDPLGMTMTGHHRSWKELVPDRASGYDPISLDQVANSQFHDYSADPGSGSMYSSTSDLLLWVKGLTSGKILTPETTAMIFSPQMDAYGYGWLVWEMFGRKVYSIDGWTNTGFTSSLYYYPEEDLSVIILSNLDISSITGELVTGLSAILFDETPEGLDLYYLPLEESITDKMVGVYHFGEDFYVPGSTLTIVKRDGKLYASEPGGILIGLLPLSETEFIHRSSWGKVKFEIDENNEINRIFFYDQFWVEKNPVGSLQE